MVSITRSTVPQEVETLKSYAPYLMFCPSTPARHPAIGASSRCAKTAPPGHLKA